MGFRVRRQLGNVRVELAMPMRAMVATARRVRRFEVQDCLGTIVALDCMLTMFINWLNTNKSSLRYLPQCVYVKLDECDHVFLLAKCCSKHGSTGYSPQCSNCSSMVGASAIKPLKRKWHFLPGMMDFKCTVERTRNQAGWLQLWEWFG